MSSFHTVEALRRTAAATSAASPAGAPRRATIAEVASPDAMADESALQQIAAQIARVAARGAGDNRARLLRLLCIEMLDTVGDTIDSDLIFDGCHGLTNAEKEVMRHVAMGKPSRQIARDIGGKSLGTIKSQLAAVMLKLNATTRTHAVHILTQRARGMA